MEAEEFYSTMWNDIYKDTEHKQFNYKEIIEFAKLYAEHYHSQQSPTISDEALKDILNKILVELICNAKLNKNYSYLVKYPSTNSIAEFINDWVRDNISVASTEAEEKPKGYEWQKRLAKLKKQLEENESNHDYAIATDTVRCIIDGHPPEAKEESRED